MLDGLCLSPRGQEAREDVSLLCCCQLMLLLDSMAGPPSGLLKAQRGLDTYVWAS